MAADRFSLLAGIASDWWWEMGADLRFTFVSDRLQELLGLPVSSIIGKRRNEVPRTDYDNTAAWQAHIDDLENHRSFRNFETTVVDAAGASRPVMISGTPKFAEDGTFEGYIGVGNDLTELRRHEREASQTAASLESILENIEQGVVLFDAQHRIVSYNRRLAEWLQIDGDVRGMSYEEAVRRLAQRGEYGTADPEAAVALRLELARVNKNTVIERKRADGRTVSVGYNPLPGGGGVMTYSDVTEVRDREARLEESEARFRYLFRHSPLPMWVYSLDNRDILEVNDAAVAAYGYSREEFLHLNLYDLRPPDEIDRLRQYLHDVTAAQLFAGEWRHRHKDGKIVDVEVYLHDIEFDGRAARLALLNDVTDRKRLERESQRIFETSEDLMLVSDGYGRFLQVSPSCERVLGYRPDEMVGRGAQDFLVAEDLEANREEMRLARRGESVRRFRARFHHKDGRVVPLAWVSTWSSSDRRHYFIGRDMTEYDATAASLRQAVKMDAIGQLTGGVAHDFNNLLMVIMANLDALDEETDLDRATRNRIRRIGNATQRARDLTGQLLAFSRRQALQPVATDINELVHGTVGLLRRTLGEMIEVETVLGGGLWDADIDRAQLEASLVNLAINARDAMPDGGRLRVSTANLSRPVGAERDGIGAGDFVVVSVSDTGKGMPSSVLEKAFEPFFTTKAPGKGTGLGLSMVYGFLQQSRGHVRIESEVGRGTTVRLYLPRSSEAASTAASPAADMERGSERILVVEDDARVRTGVMEQLESLGYEVTGAGDGAAGLAAFEAAPQPFDLLLTDVIVPGPMNGKALADEVRRRWPATRLVFMSGYSENILSTQGRLEPGVLLLNKPFRKHELAKMVRTALDTP
ncbi:MAG: PAS domain S-box protein [Reyranella sp.]|nr:PAS domain S-box protein [Reyranella sp.]